MSRDFQGLSVIVTGAASGIGRATALLFAAQGASVLAMDLHADSGLAGQGSIVAMRGDAGNEADVAAMIAAATRAHGVPDIIVANAGISGGTAGLFDQDAADWTEVLRINLTGAFLAIKHGARAMIDAGRRGAIICTASVAGLRAGAGGAAYSASKAGVINLVQNAAQELTGSGIRVNAVCPGLIETGMTKPVYEAARAHGRGDQIGRLNPLQRGGEVREIAEAIAFLASPGASYVNGHALVVDGGLSTSHPFAKPRKQGAATL